MTTNKSWFSIDQQWSQDQEICPKNMTVLCYKQNNENVYLYNAFEIFTVTTIKKQLEMWWWCCCCSTCVFETFLAHKTILVLTCCLMSDLWKGKPESRMKSCEGMHYARDLTVVSSSFHTPVFNVSKSVHFSSIPSFRLSPFPISRENVFSNSCSIFSLPPSLSSSSTLLHKVINMLLFPLWLEPDGFSPISL